jgi:uncharacterized membrane protein
MTISDSFQVALFLSTFLCSLVAGFVFGFSVVVMPGTMALRDREFLQAFKAMDAVIQNNHPLFMLVWVGSIIAIVTTVALGVGYLKGIELYLLLVATLAYLLGVQLPTIRFNIPLNNKLQSLNLIEMSNSELANVRSEFEPEWNRWNRFRTIVSCFSVTLLLVLIFRL